MNNPPTLTEALCLPALDIEALLQGRTLAAIAQIPSPPSPCLLLPVDITADTAELAQRYHTRFLNSLKKTPTPSNPDILSAYAWAECTNVRAYSDPAALETLSWLTVWSYGYLQQLLQRHSPLYLLELRVHRFTEPVELVAEPLAESQAGGHLALPYPVSTSGSQAVLDDESFCQQQRLRPAAPLHLALETLQGELVGLRESHLGAMALDRDLRYLLGWSRADETRWVDSDLSWIAQMTPAGRAEARLTGHHPAFLRLVRRGLGKLGFKGRPQAPTDDFERAVNPGAGQLAIDYLRPYRLVGTCQVGHRTPLSAAALEYFLQLGHVHLGRAAFAEAIKLLVVAGPITDSAHLFLTRNAMNILRPHTLQRLCELNAQHPGAIDLIALKQVLQAAPYGEAADSQVNGYIEQTLAQLNIRAALVRAVKTCQLKTGQATVTPAAISQAYAAIAADQSLPPLPGDRLYQLLIELASPLAGYLGCLPDSARSFEINAGSVNAGVNAGEQGSLAAGEQSLSPSLATSLPTEPRFYFLRELRVVEAD